MTKADCKKRFYLSRKMRNLCVGCGKKLEKNSSSFRCDVCKVRVRISHIDSRLRKLERFIDNYLKEKEQQKA